MNRLLTAIVTIIVCNASPLTSQVLPDTHQLYDEVRKLIRFETEIESPQTPGILIGIIDHDRKYLLSIGQREHRSDGKPGINDLFEIGSLSKLFTSAITTRLVQEGRLDWNLPIERLLPPGCVHPAYRQITLLDLVTHQSGLPKYPPFIGAFEGAAQDRYANYPKSEICNALSQPELTSGKSPRYSHLNYAVLEMILEGKAGKRFEDLAEALLFRPLGMNASTFMPVDTLAPGYDRAGYPAKPMRFRSFLGAEGAKSTLPDLMTFLAWQMGLMPRNRIDMGIPQIMAEGRYPSGLGNEILFTQGWFLIHPRKKRDVFIYSGRTKGHHASISYCSQTRTGVVTLSNSATGTGNLGYLVLRMINHNWKRKPHG